MKKVSVVIPCYNVAEYLDRCIEHLLKQTIGKDNIEIILVDDASTDDGATLKLIMEYEQRYPDVVIAISLQQNMRQGGARNVGVSYAGGEYLMFCDADDWLAVEAMDHLYRIAKAYDTDVIDFREKKVSPDMQIDETVVTGNDSYLWGIDNEEKRSDFLMESSPTCTLGCWRKFYRMELIRENNIRFIEGLICEEPSFTFPIRFYIKKNLFLDETLYFYFQAPNSTMHSNWDDRKFDNVKVWLSIIEDLERRGLHKKYSQEIEYVFFIWGYKLTVKMLLQKGYMLTKEELGFLCKMILQLFPDICENEQLLKSSSEMTQILMDVLKMELTDENVKDLNCVLRNYI